MFAESTEVAIRVYTMLPTLEREELHSESTGAVFAHDGVCGGSFVEQRILAQEL